MMGLEDDPFVIGTLCSFSGASCWSSREYDSIWSFNLQLPIWISPFYDGLFHSIYDASLGAHFVDV